MATLTIDLPAEVVTLLETINHTPEHTARELIVLELYHRALLSREHTAQLLNISVDDLETPSDVLETMLANITPENRHDEIDTEPAQGKEYW
jgi:antitoxin component of MazEF toxin-antitoxin module